MDTMIKGFIAGAFDLLHPGHVSMLDMCKLQCDFLTVALHVNPKLQRKNKNKPVQTVFERWMQLNSLRSVDKIIPYETEEDLLNLLKISNADIRFLGEDYKGHPEKVTGYNLKEIVYIPRKHSWSSTELRNRLKK